MISLTIKEAVTVMVLLYLAAAIPWAGLFFLFSERPHFNSGEGRKYREEGENFNARTIPYQKDNQVDIEILKDLQKRLDGLIKNKQQRVEAVDDMTNDVMEKLDYWIKK